MPHAGLCQAAMVGPEGARTAFLFMSIPNIPCMYSKRPPQYVNSWPLDLRNLQSVTSSPARSIVTFESGSVNLSLCKIDNSSGGHNTYPAIDRYVLLCC